MSFHCRIEEQARMSREQLVQSGTMIDSLRIAGLPSTSGSFGETIVKFVPNDSQKMSSLPQSELKKGDIVGIVEQSKWPSRASSRSSFKSRNWKERKTGHAQKSTDARAQKPNKLMRKVNLKTVIRIISSQSCQGPLYLSVRDLSQCHLMSVR